ncbi:MAG: N-6 DNA methylase, partial [Tepidimonas sp.]|nr:N-6 DNA methylase [Tepidimonas sp.]
VEVNGKSYPISHAWGHVPIHLVGYGVDLDRRAPGVAGAAKASPHSLLQEALNRSELWQWGFVANGARLRVLRDSVRLTRQAYLEFDLEAMFEGQVYADFALLWLICHQSRVEDAPPAACWLERWSQAAQDQGVRALDALRNGVEQAIAALGRGFLAHPANGDLRDRLRSGALTAQDYYRQLLRLVYGMLFLLVAEERDLLLDPQADPLARERYTRYYALAGIRRLAERRAGTHHPDLYRRLRLVMQWLGDAGAPALGLPALGGWLFSRAALPDLATAELANRDLLAAIRALTVLEDRHGRRMVDYQNLGAEELGSVYESLLELRPAIHVDAASFTLETLGGHERKTTGSYYTPRSLIAGLLDSALDPALDAAARQPDPERAILSLKVVDPACGSGHFLLAAAHRMARRLATIRTGDAEPAPAALRAALRAVIGRCLYGVDLNPMAVELCKVSLWLEALDPGKPLTFLDHHIRCGNSLLGATPAGLAAGIPDGAFDPVSGDDKAVCREYRKRNQRERSGQLSLFDAANTPWERLGNLTTAMLALDALPDDTIDAARRKQEQYEALVRASSYEHGWLLADLWCAALVWPKVTTAERPYPITEEVFRRVERTPYDLPAWLRAEVQRLAAHYRFFHWHLAFPDVFRPAVAGEPATPAGWTGGFDVVLGNPPWERIKLQEQEHFADVPAIARAANKAERERVIAAWRNGAPHQRARIAEYDAAKYRAEAESRFVRVCGRYPRTAVGDVNTYALFAELARSLLAPHGRAGIIVPTGIATDDSTKAFFADLVQRRQLISLYDFENR